MGRTAANSQSSFLPSQRKLGQHLLVALLDEPTNPLRARIILFAANISFMGPHGKLSSTLSNRRKVERRFFPDYSFHVVAGNDIIAAVLLLALGPS